MLAAAQNLEDQLVAFVAVFAGQGLQPFERRSLQRFEPISREYFANSCENAFTPSQGIGEKVSRAGGGFELL
ncbi:hypothetical protein Acsp04_58510 [Actinomadura sp. NBRC 104425]|nr:hypothetical protein Acsp04_58510 [Actinomadura sp. NBRC 104425]